MREAEEKYGRSEGRFKVMVAHAVRGWDEGDGNASGR